MNLKIAGSAVIAVAAFAFQAQAHHSFAMFDQEKTISVKVDTQRLAALKERSNSPL
jgi:hypothetical protein